MRKLLVRSWILGGFALILSTLSCEKPAGEGGTATLQGKVFVRDFDAAGNFKSEYFAQNERVFIIYGDNEVQDDDTRTNYDGTYEFNYLQKGLYTIYAYSNCDTCASEEEPIFQQIEIDNKGQTYEVPLITIIK